MRDAVQMRLALEGSHPLQHHPHSEKDSVAKFHKTASPPPPRPDTPSSTHVNTMRPILLSGHERALTQVKYNPDGDIIFSVSKDHVVCAWCS